MADAVTSQTVLNGPRNLVRHFTNESDGTGESAVTKVDATSTTFGAPGVHLKIKKIKYDVKGGAVRIQWKASSNTDAVVISGYGTLDYTDIGGLVNPAGAGADGSIQFTTVGFGSGASYTITLEMIKAIGT